MRGSLWDFLGHRVEMERAASLLSEWLSSVTPDDRVVRLLGDSAAAFKAVHLGLRWPVLGKATYEITTPDAPIDLLAVELLIPLFDSSSKLVVVQGNRAVARILMANRTMGAVAAQYAQPPNSEQLAILELFARSISHSPVWLSAIGSGVDPERLLQRLADSSIVCGRMAHDFDNILTGILGFSDLTLPMLPAGSLPHQYITEVSKVGQRGIVFTQQLHQLSRSGQTKPQPSLLSQVMTREESRIEPLLPAGTRLIKSFPADLPAVAIEAGALQTVISHVIDNAIEAAKKDSTITISARVVKYGMADFVLYLGSADPGTFVELTVTDTGIGIKPEVRARLFVEPFYTTKVRHRGLGLAIIYRILHAHRGAIQMDADNPSQTIVRLLLPVVPKRPGVVT